MSLWLHWIGNDEFRPIKRSSPPQGIWLSLSIASIFVLVHEAILAPAGLDLLAGYRPESRLADPLFLVWAVPAAVAAFLVPRGLRETQDGQKMRVASIVSISAATLGAFVLAFSAPKGSQLIETVQAIFWGSMSVLFLIYLALSITTSPDKSGREPWAIQLLCLMLAPALWPVMGFTLFRLDYSPIDVIAGGLGLAFSTLILVGYVLAWRPTLSYSPRSAVANE